MDLCALPEDCVEVGLIAIAGDAIRWRIGAAPEYRVVEIIAICKCCDSTSGNALSGIV